MRARIAIALFSFIPGILCAHHSRAITIRASSSSARCFARQLGGQRAGPRWGPGGFCVCSLTNTPWRDGESCSREVVKVGIRRVVKVIIQGSVKSLIRQFTGSAFPEPTVPIPRHDGVDPVANRPRHVTQHRQEVPRAPEFSRDGDGRIAPDERATAADEQERIDAIDRNAVPRKNSCPRGDCMGTNVNTLPESRAVMKSTAYCTGCKCRRISRCWHQAAWHSHFTRSPG